MNCIYVCVVKLIINKIIRNKMQKLNHMSINDILQKRKARILSKKNNVKTVDNHTFSFEEKDLDLV